MKKIFNFSAGPAVLPDEALQAAAAAVVNYRDSGMSLLEMSHRSQAVVNLMAETNGLARRLLAVPDNYHIIWLQGGASTQFSMIPMNLLPKNVLTGSFELKTTFFDLTSQAAGRCGQILSKTRHFFCPMAIWAVQSDPNRLAIIFP